jgi:hypothetical protein
VVPSEITVSSYLAPAVQAQAIAARTYAFWHIKTDAQQPGSINNTDEYQVFIPRTYDRLSAEAQRQVDAAVLQNRYYLSYKEGYTVNIYGQNITLTEQDPIFAEFTADVRERTIANAPYAYLASVDDPISSHPTVPTLLGHGHGLSQNGAGRWARGSESYRCDPDPAPCSPPIEPPAQAWSVQWQDVLQILSHYYTNIHLRDTNNSNQQRTPVYRWVPLKLQWAPNADDPPARVCAGTALQPTVWIQNSGTATWRQGKVSLLARNDTQASAILAPTGLIPQEVLPGDSVTTTVRLYPPAGHPAGTPYTYSLDMIDENSGYFSGQTSSWPVYTGTIPNLTVIECNQANYLPLIQAGAVVSQ